MGFREHEGIFQIRQGGIIEVELALERPVRDTASLAEQCEDLIEHRIKVHNRPSLCVPGSAQTASEPWGPCLQSQNPARNAAR
jgi:hypothetical protein